MHEFVIDFTYQQQSYSGLVSPKKAGNDILYSVKVESQSQEFNLDVTATPCGEGKFEWCFSGKPEEQNSFDKNLLLEIGEAIEKYQSGSL